MATETRPYDSARYLDSDRAIAEYATDAFESGDPSVITYALGAAARARGMTQVAKEAGLSRDSLYKALAKPAIRSSARSFASRRRWGSR